MLCTVYNNSKKTNLSKQSYHGVFSNLGFFFSSLIPDVKGAIKTTPKRFLGLFDAKSITAVVPIENPINRIYKNAIINIKV